jgi:hypothetical protein
MMVDLFPEISGIVLSLLLPTVINFSGMLISVSFLDPYSQQFSQVALFN